MNKRTIIFHRFRILFVSLFLLPLIAGNCNNTTKSDGNAIDPVTNKIDLYQPGILQFPTLQFQVYVNIPEGGNRDVKIVIFNADLGTLAAEQTFTVTANYSGFLNVDANISGVFNQKQKLPGNYKAFCYDKTNPEYMSVIREFKIGTPMSIENDACLAGLIPRNYKLYYSFNTSFDARVTTHHSNFEAKYEASKIHLQITPQAVQGFSGQLNLASGTAIEALISNHISSQIPNYNTTDYEGLVISLDKVTGFPGESIGGFTLTGKSLPKSNQRHVVIMCGSIEELFTASSGNYKTASLIHELSHQIINSRHNLNYSHDGTTLLNVTGLTTTDYLHGGCCVLQATWPGSNCNVLSFDFCGPHKCYLANIALP